MYSSQINNQGEIVYSIKVVSDLFYKKDDQLKFVKHRKKDLIELGCIEIKKLVKSKFVEITGKRKLNPFVAKVISNSIIQKEIESKVYKLKMENNFLNQDLNKLILLVKEIKRDKKIYPNGSMNTNLLIKESNTLVQIKKIQLIQSENEQKIYQEYKILKMVSK